MSVSKRKSDSNESPNAKKVKTDKQDQKPEKKFSKDKNFSKKDSPAKGKDFKKDGKPSFQKSYQKGNKDGGKDQAADKPPNWNEFKKQKKELRIKRKQTNTYFDVITKAKQISEKLRRRNLEGGKQERDKLVAELHTMLGGKGSYVRFVLSHDMGRVVQYLLKFGKQEIRDEVAKELIPSTVIMLQSKYGKFCIKRLLKYGNADIRSQVIRSCYGHAVKLTSHSVSAPIFEYAYATWAQPLEKIHLIQEFFGDMYKQSKEDKVKHLRDVYKDSPDMKKASLEATKANLTRILNKNLLDSGLVQSVMSQFISECSEAERAELLTQVAPHVVILSNSKDGAKVVMHCIWNGTNKDRKVAMKALKEHVIELCKHEHGHTAILALLDVVDDTVLLNKMILTDILSNTLDLAKNEWGRKVLLWLVAPANSTHFHPTFNAELQKGRENSTCKKSPEIRRKEILTYCVNSLLQNVTENAKIWLETASMSVVALTILKTGEGEKLKEAFESIVKVIVDVDWKIKDEDTEVLGVEHAGLHMTLKKLIQNDKILVENNSLTFSEVLVEFLTEDVVKLWTGLNRGCFLLVAVFENGSESSKNELKQRLSSLTKRLKKQSCTGAKILLKKLE